MKHVHLLLLSICCITWAATAQERYQKNDISFDYPEDWKVVEDVEINAGHYIIVADNSEVSGRFSVTCLNGVVYPEVIFNEIEENLSDYSFKSPFNPIFSETFETKLNQIQVTARAFSYEDGILDPYRGTIYYFTAEGRTFFLIKDEAVDAELENLKAFNTIFSSFRNVTSDR